MLELRPEHFSLADYSSHSIAICGKKFIADMSGALFWPGERLLVVADLHLEKGSAYAANAQQMLPPYDTRETLLRLARVIDKYSAGAVLALGDSFHDAAGYARMSEDDRTILQIMQEDRRWIWVTGNHDTTIAPGAGGEIRDAVVMEGLTFRHDPLVGSVTHEIAGHLHPAAKLSVYGHSIRRPCFVGNGRRLVLPAFGAFTGGLNILDDAFAGLFGNASFAVWMLGDDGLYPVAPRLLKPDRIAASNGDRSIRS